MYLELEKNYILKLTIEDLGGKILRLRIDGKLFLFKIIFVNWTLLMHLFHREFLWIICYELKEYISK